MKNDHRGRRRLILTSHVPVSRIRTPDGILGHLVPPGVREAVIQKLHATRSAADLPILLVEMDEHDELIAGGEALHSAKGAGLDSVVAGRVDRTTVLQTLKAGLVREAGIRHPLIRGQALVALEGVLYDLGEPALQKDIAALLGAKETTVSGAMAIGRAVPQTAADRACDGAGIPRGSLDTLPHAAFRHFRRGRVGPTCDELLASLAEAVKHRDPDPAATMDALVQGEALLEAVVSENRVAIVGDPARFTVDERDRFAGAAERALEIVDHTIAASFLGRVAALGRSVPFIASHTTVVVLWITLSIMAATRMADVDGPRPYIRAPLALSLVALCQLPVLFVGLAPRTTRLRIDRVVGAATARVQRVVRRARIRWWRLHDLRVR
jgi:hypothetical protein